MTCMYCYLVLCTLYILSGENITAVYTMSRRRWDQNTTQVANRLNWAGDTYVWLLHLTPWSQSMSTAVRITWHTAQINFGDLPPFLTYGWIALSMNGTHEVRRVCVCWGRSSPEVLMMKIRAKGIPASQYAHASFKHNMVLAFRQSRNSSRRLIKQDQTHPHPHKKETKIKKQPVSSWSRKMKL